MNTITHTFSQPTDLAVSNSVIARVTQSRRASAVRLREACQGMPARSASLAEMPAYCVHRAKGVGYVRIAGRMIYLGRANTAESLEHYRRVLAEWLATGRLPPIASEHGKGGWTINALVDGYLNWARRYYVDADGDLSSGLAPVEAAAKQLRAVYGSTQASAFGPIALRAVRQTMISAGLCRSVVNQRIACIKRIVRWAWPKNACRSRCSKQSWPWNRFGGVAAGCENRRPCDP